MTEKRTHNLPPQDGILPCNAFDLLKTELDRAAEDAGVQGLSLEPDYEGDNIATVRDCTLGYLRFATGETEPVPTGLTVAACEIEGQSIARRLLTPGYSLTWVAAPPNDPQDGDESVEIGEYYCAEDVADEIIRQSVNYRMQLAAERRTPPYTGEGY